MRGRVFRWRSSFSTLLGVPWFSPGRALRLGVGVLVGALAVAFVSGFLLNFGDVDEEYAWTIKRFHADYTLSPSTADPRMSVTETVTVDFRAGTSRGFHRYLPTTYLGHQTSVLSVSVTRDGEPVDFRVSRLEDAVDVHIRDSVAYDETPTYEISYVYKGVVRNHDGNQALYWNVNGVSWSTSIEAVSATVHVPAEISSSLTGVLGCYQGDYGSRDTCPILRSQDAAGNVTIATGPVAVDRGGNQSLLVGFEAGTFATPPIAANARAPLTLSWVAAGLFGLVAVAYVYLAATKFRRAVGSQALVAQFSPNPELPPMLAASLVGEPGRGLVAELLRAANERHVQLLGGGNSGKPLEAQLVSWPTDWQSSSLMALEAIFRSEKPGTKVDVRATLAILTEFRIADLSGQAHVAGLTKQPQGDRALAVLFWGTVVATIAMVATGVKAALPFWWIVTPLLIVAAGSATLYGLLMRWTSLTEDGKQAYRYLAGLRLFLAASEAQRMRVVQGAETSQRIGSEELVPIFEKLLPYAVALGLEDSWQRAVGTAFQHEPEFGLQSQFDWLPGEGITAVRNSVWSDDLISRRRWRNLANRERSTLSDYSRGVYRRATRNGSRSSWSGGSGLLGGRSGGFSGGGGGGGGGRLG